MKCQLIISALSQRAIWICVQKQQHDDALYEKYGVKRSLRDLNGIGTMPESRMSLSVNHLQQMKTATVFHVPESSTIVATKSTI